MGNAVSTINYSSDSNGSSTADIIESVGSAAGSVFGSLFGTNVPKTVNYNTNNYGGQTSNSGTSWIVWLLGIGALIFVVYLIVKK